MTNNTKTAKRVAWLLGLLVIVAAAMGFAGFMITSHVGQRHLVQSRGNPVGGSFRVVTLTGSTATDSDYLGHWFLVWFVDPRCSEEQCTSPLKKLDQALTRLKEERHPIVPVIVSLDYKAPDTDDLEDYFKAHSPHIMPFYATENMIKAMTALYHAPLKKEKTDYYVPASHYVLMNSEGRYVASLPITLSSRDMHDSLLKLLLAPDKK